MCYRISNKVALDNLKKRYAAELIDEARHKAYFHLAAFNHPLVPVITTMDPALIKFFQWGFIPHWEKSFDTAQLKMLHCANARGEELTAKASFLDAWNKGMRCLIPVTGFFESHTVAKAKGKPEKIPYHISVDQEEIFSLGGLFNIYIDQTTGALHPTFTILTVEANNLMKKIHNSKERMPLIIARQDEGTWLDNELGRKEAAQLVRPFPAESMKAYTVYKDLHNPRIDANCAEALEHVAYDELSALS